MPLEDLNQMIKHAEIYRDFRQDLLDEICLFLEGDV